MLSIPPVRFLLWDMQLWHWVILLLIWQIRDMLLQKPKSQISATNNWLYYINNNILIYLVMMSVWESPAVKYFLTGIPFVYTYERSLLWLCFAVFHQESESFRRRCWPDSSLRSYAAVCGEEAVLPVQLPSLHLHFGEAGFKSQNGRVSLSGDTERDY